MKLGLLLLIILPLVYSQSVTSEYVRHVLTNSTSKCADGSSSVVFIKQRYQRDRLGHNV